MRTILVVDDEHGLADVLEATLSDLGFRVQTATNGVQALERMRQQRPDLILLDYMMPLLNGPGVLAAMQTDERLASVPVIIMSSLPEDAVSAQRDRYTAYLRKPFAFEQLLSTVERVLGT